MFSVVYADDILTKVFLFAGYVFSVCLIGYFQTWLADKFGDDTAKRLGWFTLNPFVHVRLMGVIFLMLLRVAWTRPVPYDTRMVTGSWRPIKRFLIATSGLLCAIALAVGSGVTMFLLNGSMAPSIGSSVRQVAHLFPGSSAFVVMAVVALSTLFTVNLSLAFFSAIFAAVNPIVVWLLKRYPHWSVQSEWVVMAVLIVLVFIFPEGLFYSAILSLINLISVMLRYLVIG
ncbi:hypothetical protein HOL34_02700 [bacterium]|jgi:hypothetical protein|nr:hypothetical protein [bacterium]MBT3903651.1 hypothetical protein [bacterium]MBT4577963.1 hypothetical protein [bacterium]MBT5345810.1 hypothetical protein [bacterium]MBT6131431.1 hypothetical protein [bacterium]